jgi:hypothetical protein
MISGEAEGKCAQTTFSSGSFAPLRQPGMTGRTDNTLTPETLSKARDRALDLTQPAVLITDLCDRGFALATDLAALGTRLASLALDLRGQSVALDERICKLVDVLDATEEGDQ